MNASWPDSGYDLPQTVNCQITASLFLGFDKKAEEFISSLILSLFVSFPVSELSVTVLKDISCFCQFCHQGHGFSPSEKTLWSLYQV